MNCEHEHSRPAKAQYLITPLDLRYHPLATCSRHMLTIPKLVRKIGAVTVEVLVTDE